MLIQSLMPKLLLNGIMIQLFKLLHQNLMDLRKRFVVYTVPNWEDKVGKKQQAKVKDSISKAGQHRREGTGVGCLFTLWWLNMKSPASFGPLS